MHRVARSAVADASSARSAPIAQRPAPDDVAAFARYAIQAASAGRAVAVVGDGASAVGQIGASRSRAFDPFAARNRRDAI